MWKFIGQLHTRLYNFQHEKDNFRLCGFLFPAGFIGAATGVDAMHEVDIQIHTMPDTDCAVEGPDRIYAGCG
jgi:hypothetical protein